MASRYCQGSHDRTHADPSVLQCRFADLPTSLLITFSQSTDGGRCQLEDNGINLDTLNPSQVCPLFFTSAFLSELGSGPECQWISDKVCVLPVAIPYSIAQRADAT